MRRLGFRVGIGLAVLASLWSTRGVLGPDLWWTLGLVLGVLVAVTGLAVVLPRLVRHQRGDVAQLDARFVAGIGITLAGLALCVLALVRIGQAGAARVS